MQFSQIPTIYAKSPLPTLEDWEAVWAAWDVITRGMLPREELEEKPIKLRNACIFYLGHIPTFLDIQLTKTTKEPPTNPASYWTIFERGIDPDVDNPEHCHAHSEIPDEWPPVDQIIEYQDRVRSRLRALYEGGQERIPRGVARAIWVGFEHELMHMETLLYMMLQSDKTLPPPHTAVPDFKKLAEKAQKSRVQNEWHDVPAQSVTIGLDDPEDGTDSAGHFGWDNEKPVRKVEVHAFQAKGRPITNEEYAQYMYSKDITKLPASWARAADKARSAKMTNGSNGVNGVNGNAASNTNGHTNGLANGHANGHSLLLPESFVDSMSVRTMYGLVPLRYALDWPVYGSYDELSGCALWMGGRIPTFEEAKSIYAQVNNLKKQEAERTLGRTVPAVNGHLSNDGVEETPPSVAAAQVGESPATDSELFVDLDGANVGFNNWHPTPVTANGNRLAGQSEFGGVWEWTSSPLTRWEGFEPMALYPQYTVDFFDDKHNIVLGGSWATHPRIAGRKSFVNFYQRNYPFCWVGARLVRDIE